MPPHMTGMLQVCDVSVQQLAVYNHWTGPVVSFHELHRQSDTWDLYGAGSPGIN